MPIDFACPSCGREYKVYDDLAGKRVRCKSCSADMTVPDTGDTPAQDEPDAIAFACDHCGRSYRVAADLAGRSVRCKNCGSVLTIPETADGTEDYGLAGLHAAPRLPGSPFSASAGSGHLGSASRLGSAAATDYTDIRNWLLFGGLGAIGLGAALWFLGINGIEVRKGHGVFHGQPPDFALQVGFGRVSEAIGAVMVAAAYIGAWFRYQTSGDLPEVSRAGLVGWIAALALAVLLTALNLLGICTSPPGG